MEVEKVEAFKHLGVVIYDKLRWNNHIESLLNVSRSVSETFTI